MLREGSAYGSEPGVATRSLKTSGFASDGAGVGGGSGASTRGGLGGGGREGVPSEAASAERENAQRVRIARLGKICRKIIKNVSKSSNHAERVAALTSENDKAATATPLQLRAGVTQEVYAAPYTVAAPLTSGTGPSA